MAKKKTPLNEVDRLLESKLKLIERLHGEIKDVRASAEIAVKKIASRIRVAQALADALKKGTLKP